jgi:O-acetyl-ADP-ribose deacetylase (regulator of RNase III)
VADPDGGPLSEITFCRGDLFAADAQALVNAVNCVGVMGRGIALQFKEVYPENFRAYASACRRGEVVPGRMFITERGARDLPRYLINFPTKRHWRDASRMEDLETGLSALAADLQRLGVESVALPALGAGLGGLPWPEVRARIVAALSPLPGVQVTVYEPLDAAH